MKHSRYPNMSIFRAEEYQRVYEIIKNHNTPNMDNPILYITAYSSIVGQVESFLTEILGKFKEFDLLEDIELYSGIKKNKCEKCGNDFYEDKTKLGFFDRTFIQKFDFFSKKLNTKDFHTGFKNQMHKINDLRNNIFHFSEISWGKEYYGYQDRSSNNFGEYITLQKVEELNNEKNILIKLFVKKMIDILSKNKLYHKYFISSINCHREWFVSKNTNL